MIWQNSLNVSCLSFPMDKNCGKITRNPLISEGWDLRNEGVMAQGDRWVEKRRKRRTSSLREKQNSQTKGQEIRWIHLEKDFRS